MKPLRERSEEYGAELVQIDELHAKGVEAARRRVAPIVRMWAACPAISSLDLMWLAVSCYLQGTVDGFDVAERARTEG